MDCRFIRRYWCYNPARIYRDFEKGIYMVMYSVGIYVMINFEKRKTKRVGIFLFLWKKKFETCLNYQ